MQMMYSVAVAHLAGERPVVERVTGLYALFLLYRTQRAVPAVRIYVTPQQVDLMAALARELKAMGAADGIHVLREMYDDGAFVVGRCRLTV